MSQQSKERKEKGTVGLMRRLTSIKRSKSPPPSSYSMDNPVFEDTVSVATAHPVHVRYTINLLLACMKTFFFVCLHESF